MVTSALCQDQPLATTWHCPRCPMGGPAMERVTLGALGDLGEHTEAEGICRFYVLGPAPGVYETANAAINLTGGSEVSARTLK